MEDKLKNLDKENIIWLIYIFIFVMAIVSNYYEEKYLFTKDYKSKKVYKNINLTILVIGILIYLYFVIINYENIRNSKYGSLREFASIMFFIAGTIYLYIEYQGQNEIEVGII